MPLPYRGAKKAYFGSLKECRTRDPVILRYNAPVVLVQKGKIEGVDRKTILELALEDESKIGEKWYETPDKDKAWKPLLRPESDDVSWILVIITLHCRDRYSALLTKFADV